jgi:hypothetical protein
MSRYNGFLEFHIVITVLVMSLKYNDYNELPMYAT